jgi:hypothetical protein
MKENYGVSKVGWKRYRDTVSSLDLLPPSIFTSSATWMPSKPHPFGSLCRFHYQGIIG